MFRQTHGILDETAAPQRPAESNPETPDFTVVIPTYNRPEALRSCLESLAAQRYPRALFEVVVVDDGSETPAAKVVADYSDCLQVSVLREGRRGVASARNHGAMNARGDYVAFIDDDCRAEPEWLSGLASGFKEYPRGALLGGLITNPYDDNIYAEVGELILSVILERYKPERGGLYFFRTANMAVNCEDFQTAGGFDRSFETAEDREFCDRWLARGGMMVRVLPAVVAHASPLSFRSFLLRHYRYGRGAYRFHRLRRQRGSGQFRLRFLWFYFFVIQACVVSRRFVGRKLALVFLWQLCNVLGFIAEYWHTRSTPMPSEGTS